MEYRVVLLFCFSVLQSTANAFVRNLTMKIPECRCEINECCEFGVCVPKKESGEYCFTDMCCKPGNECLWGKLYIPICCSLSNAFPNTETPRKENDSGIVSIQDAGKASQQHAEHQEIISSSINSLFSKFSGDNPPISKNNLPSVISGDRIQSIPVSIDPSTLKQQFPMYEDAGSVNEKTEEPNYTTLPPSILESLMINEELLEDASVSDKQFSPVDVNDLTSEISNASDDEVEKVKRRLLLPPSLKNTIKSRRTFKLKEENDYSDSAWTNDANNIAKPKKILTNRSLAVNDATNESLPTLKLNKNNFGSNSTNSDQLFAHSNQDAVMKDDLFNHASRDGNNPLPIQRPLVKKTTSVLPPMEKLEPSNYLTRDKGIQTENPTSSSANSIQGNENERSEMNRVSGILQNTNSEILQELTENLKPQPTDNLKTFGEPEQTNGLDFPTRLKDSIYKLNETSQNFRQITNYNRLQNNARLNDIKNINVISKAVTGSPTFGSENPKDQQQKINRISEKISHNPVQDTLPDASKLSSTFNVRKFDSSALLQDNHKVANNTIANSNNALPNIPKYTNIHQSTGIFTKESSNPSPTQMITQKTSPSEINNMKNALQPESLGESLNNAVPVRVSDLTNQPNLKEISLNSLKTTENIQNFVNKGFTVLPAAQETEENLNLQSISNTVEKLQKPLADPINDSKSPLEKSSGLVNSNIMPIENTFQNDPDNDTAKNVKTALGTQTNSMENMYPTFTKQSSPLQPNGSDRNEFPSNYDPQQLHHLVSGSTVNKSILPELEDFPIEKAIGTPKQIEQQMSMINNNMRNQQKKFGDVELSQRLQNLQSHAHSAMEEQREKMKDYTDARRMQTSQQYLRSVQPNESPAQTSGGLQQLRRNSLNRRSRHWGGSLTRFTDEPQSSRFMEETKLGDGQLNIQLVDKNAEDTSTANNERFPIGRALSSNRRQWNNWS